MILLLGATGYIGSAFAAELRRRAIPFTPLTRKALDYTRFEAIFDYVHKLKPEFLINAAGAPGDPFNADGATARAQAIQANTLLPQTLARVCYLTKTPLGHVSSGSIYSGAPVNHPPGVQIERDLNQAQLLARFEAQPETFRGFSETDPPNCTFRSPPCSFYTGTKALAEESLSWYDQCFLWRPQLIFDELDHPRNYLTLLRRKSAGTGGINSLTHRGDFVRACVELWHRRAPFGAYHLVNPGASTDRQILALLEQRGLQLPESPSNAAQLGSAPRMTQLGHGLLNPGKLLALGIPLRPLREALEDSLDHWQSSP